MPSQQADLELRPGLSIAQYELIRELGRGGMGVVYLARDTRLGRRVAIKFLLGGNRGLSESFLREARATAACQHENILIVYEVGEHRAVPYMVLEYLEGHTLRGLLNGRQLAPRRVVELMLPVARALVRAHELEIVHRDLKPENVFLTVSGGIKVLDFGIASLLGEQASASRNQQAAIANPGDDDLDGDTAGVDAAAGTPAYMSPEQFGADGIDQRSDLWAFGVMLYEMLAGQHPVQPLNSRELQRQAKAFDEPMPELGGAVVGVPFRLGQLVQRCLRKSKEHRIQSAREVVQEMEALLPSRAQRERGAEDGPYPGLLAFQENEADRFFGRGADVQRVTARLQELSLAAVIGPSGVGKSSFARAGVIPALKTSGERWEAFVVRPGRHPLQSVASALRVLSSTTRVREEQAAPVAGAGTDSRALEQDELSARLLKEPGYLGALLRSRALQRNQKILLFIDQFEELYTLVADEAERDAFVAALCGVADDPAAPLRVLLSLRSDFLDRLGAHKHFAEAVARGLVFLQPLAQEALREALVAPVEQLGYAFENEAMVSDMVQALATTPGALPLLQFAGSKLWEARDPRRRVLTEASYREMGGVSGVLSQHADQVVNSLPLRLQRLTRTLFQRLITADGTRAVVELSEVAELDLDPALIPDLVHRLVEARLLIVQRSGHERHATVELVHESLITRWPLLRRWIDEGRDDGVFLEQLRTTARLWHARGRPQGLLWTGQAMADARRFRLRHQQALPQNEEAYLDAVARLATRAQRKRRAGVIGIIASLSLVIAGGAVALVQVRRAEQQAIQQARVASHEASRARAAELEVKQQLELVEREQAAKARAEAAVARGKLDLQGVNVELQASLERTSAESERARSAAARSLRLALSLRTSNQTLESTNGQLQSLLADERARAERLELERGKIATELR